MLMNIFVTGGTGFIGSHFIDSLIQRQNTDVFALVRDPQNLKWLQGKTIHLLQGNLTSLPSLPAKLDYVFHFAASTKANKPADYYTVNQDGTASLFQSLLNQGIRPKGVFYMSSLAAAGPSLKDRPVKETDPPHPVTPYGKSKLAGEAEALKYQETFPVYIYRVGPVFGPRDKDFLSYFKFIKSGILPSLESHCGLMSFCYVKDLVKAFLLGMEKTLESGDIFHIADPQPYSWNDFGQAAARAMGKKSLTLKIPLSAVYAVAFFFEIISRLTSKPSIINRQKIKEMRQEGWVADTKLTCEKLHFMPDYALDEAVAETAEWYQRHGWL
jgi:dihydroflavonol-4-reductase